MTKTSLLKKTAGKIVKPVAVEKTIVKTDPAVSKPTVSTTTSVAKKATTVKMSLKAGKPQSTSKLTEKPLPEPKEKIKKTKLIRDSFTMPEAEYAVLGDVKKSCLKAGIAVKKSELLRVGLALIRQLDTADLQEVLARLPTLKVVQPKKSK